MIAKTVLQKYLSPPQTFSLANFWARCWPWYHSQNLMIVSKLVEDNLILKTDVLDVGIASKMFFVQPLCEARGPKGPAR